MRVLIIGSLAGELGQAARMAMARGARLDQADDAEAGLARLRADARVRPRAVRPGARRRRRWCAALAAERMAVPVVACGVNADADAAVRAIRAGAREFLPLPPDPDLIAAILEAASRREPRAGGARPGHAGRPCAAPSRWPRAEASVLITGESGTGKEVLARHIHRRSRRAGRPVRRAELRRDPGEPAGIANCSATRRARSPARVARRVGKFEAADGGTLLLDEISEMDVRLQAKLLRALQEREIDRRRRQRAGAGERAHPGHHQPRPAGRGGARHVPRGSVFPPERGRRCASRRCASGRATSPPLAEHFARRYAEVNGLPTRPLSRRRAAAAGRAWLARQRARAGEHHAPRRAAGRRRQHRRRCDRTRAGRRRRQPAARRTGAGRRGRRRAGRPPHGRRRARPDPGDADATRWATAPTPRPSWAFPSAPCATSCATTPPQGIAVPPPPAGIAVPLASLAGLTPPCRAAAPIPLTGLATKLRLQAPGTDVGLALGVVALLSVLILPLPHAAARSRAWRCRITASVLVLMVALFLHRPLDFTSFPTLLLLTTLLRLSLNVATTRLILSHGNEGPLGRRPRGRGVRRLPDGRRRGDRPDPVRHPAGGELHGHHQGLRPHRRGGGAVQPGCHARQADGDRRRTVRRR